MNLLFVGADINDIHTIAVPSSSGETKTTSNDPTVVRVPEECSIETIEMGIMYVAQLHPTLYQGFVDALASNPTAMRAVDQLIEHLGFSKTAANKEEHHVKLPLSIELFYDRTDIKRSRRMG